MSLKGYEKVTEAIDKYRNLEINLNEFRGRVLPYASSLEEELGYDKRDFYQSLDNWFEYIEFCYMETSWRELALSIGLFLEMLIEEEPRPFSLPCDDRVVVEKGL